MIVKHIFAGNLIHFCLFTGCRRLSDARNCVKLLSLEEQDETLGCYWNTRLPLV